MWIKPLLAVVVAASSAHAASTPLKCNPTVVAAERGDPRVRRAAQKGLDFLAHDSKAWTQKNSSCYGCHVHSVTLEGLVIGRKNQYTVASADMATMIDVMRTKSNGIHSSTFVTARAFGGVALARYDRWIDGAYSDDLIKVSRKLMESQNPDGSVKVDDTRFPVESGVMQATFQAMQSWRQSFARTADDAWLAPIRKAEQYIQSTAAAWQEAPAQLQDLNYALMGLSAAGVGAGETLTARLTRFLLAKQKHDGGWGFRAESDAFATGQSLYALRTLGRSDKEQPVSRGLDWLMQHQKENGSWGGTVSNQGGSALGEAMWAVLGLVSVDVMSVAIKGIGDGEHVDGTIKISAEAKDNQSGGVAQLELLVDDLPVKTVCGAKLDHAWNTQALRDGKHIVDVVATNAKGQVSRRRFEVYAGKFFLTQVGARFDEGTQKSHISLRNIAPAGRTGTVSLEVLKDGAKVSETSRAATQGAISFDWEGKKGLYTARLSFKDADGKVVQREETSFFHDREEVAKSRFGQVEGRLSMKGGAGVAANTELELVDDQGNVKQRVRTTEQGNYLFKNVDGGKYKVRMRKEGWKDQEVPVQAAPAAPAAKADFSL
jgi:hypothetical protein